MTHITPIPAARPGAASHYRDSLTLALSLIVQRDRVHLQFRPLLYSTLYSTIRALYEPLPRYVRYVQYYYISVI